MTSKGQVYVSVDIECTGPCPGLHSMISIGAVACIEDDTEPHGYRILGDFEVNLEELPESTRNEDTMKNFWAKHPKAWELSTENPRPPPEAMFRFRKWLQGLRQHGHLVFAAYPSGFDFTFIYWYFHNFAGYCDFGFAPLDMKSYASAILGRRYREVVKRNMPKEWFRPFKGRRHHALADAKDQAYMLFQMMKTAEGMRG